MVLKERKLRTVSSAGLVERQRRLITVEEYERMGAAGIFAEDEHLELLDGEIVCMAPMGSPHAATVARIDALLLVLRGPGVQVRIQSSVWLSDGSQPEPDVAVVRAREDFYQHGHPRPADVLLIIEVAHASLAFDQQVKLPLYAGEQIPEVWIVDLNSEQVLVHRKPAGGRYQEVQAFGREATVSPEAFPELHLSVQAILG